MAVAIKKMRCNIERHSEASGDNTALTVSVAPGFPFKFLYATVAYSAAATQAGVTTTLNSGISSAYDSTLNTGTANARYTNYIPDGDVRLGEDDAIDVTAPAGGAGVTAAIAVYVERL
jgi:hypothetical protein